MSENLKIALLMAVFWPLSTLIIAHKASQMLSVTRQDDESRVRVMSLLMKLSWMFAAALLVFGVVTYRSDMHELYWVGGAWLLTLAASFYLLRRPYAKRLEKAKAAKAASTGV